MGVVVEESPFWDTERSAGYLMVAVWTFRGWVAQGRIRRYKVGRLNRFKKADLDAFVKEIAPAPSAIE